MMDTLPFSLFDSHTHIYGEEFDEDRSELMQRAKEACVTKMIMPATEEDSILRAIEFNHLYPKETRMAFGLHPESVDKEYRSQLQRIYHYLQEYQSDSALVAIGEIGLDFYWDDTFIKEQVEALYTQLEWAIEYQLPVVLHTRKAHKEMLVAIKEFQRKGLRGVFHSFTGCQDELNELLQLDSFFIGINGIVTFKKSLELRQLLHTIPLDRLLLETDAPYLAPTPKRGKRNEPAFVKYTAELIAQELKLSLPTIAEITYQNASNLFLR